MKHQAWEKKTLILLDFNGTLVYRAKGGNRVSGRRPDFTVGHGRAFSGFFLRPGAREFVCHLLNDPRCEVAIYTSIRRYNMMPVIRGLFTLAVIHGFDQYFQKLSNEGKFDPIRVGSSVVSMHSSLADGMLEVFDQSFNVPDPKGPKAWSTMRHLDLIWRHPKGRPFSESNTLIIEAELCKVRTCRENALLSAEYERKDVTSRDTTLDQLKVFLDEVLLVEMQQPGKTIPSILRAHSLDTLRFPPTG